MATERYDLIIYFFIFVVTILAACIIFIWNITKDASSVADQWMTLISQQKFEEALKISSPEMIKITTIEELNKYCKLHNMTSSNINSWNKRKIQLSQQPIAKLAGSYKKINGENESIIIKLIKINNSWMVEGISAGNNQNLITNRMSQFGRIHAGLNNN